MDRKDAFKLGFVLKLASEGVGMKELREAGEVIHKYSAKAVPVGMPRPGGVSPLTALGATAVGTGYFLPNWLGAATGTGVGTLMSSEYDTLRQAKKRYLIQRLRRMVEEAKQKERNRLLSQIKKEKPSERTERERQEPVLEVAGE